MEEKGREKSQNRTSLREFYLKKRALVCYNEAYQAERSKNMQKFLTDVHTHSRYSHDGRNTLSEMLEEAQKLGVAFYGVSEHFDYDYDVAHMTQEERLSIQNKDPSEYFHGARHLQEDYEGVMNVLVGAEFGYSDEDTAKQKYAETYEKYRPDFVINSVHSDGGRDFAYMDIQGSKNEVYKSYLALIRRSLEAPYPYDIVGHIGYVARYVPFENVDFSLDEFGEEIDDILKTIIQKGKILEINTASKHLKQHTIPSMEIVKRYYALGGRMVSIGSDAHFKERIMEKREEVVAELKTIGFTYVTVPCKGEYIKVEI